MLRPSAKTVTLSNLPSPWVSSRTLIRSLPGPAEARGYSRLSVIQMRPRSSKVMAMGLTMSGSLATSSTVKPSGTVIFLMASAGDSGGPGIWSWPCGMRSSLGEPGASAPGAAGSTAQAATATAAAATASNTIFLRISLISLATDAKHGGGGIVARERTTTQGISGRSTQRGAVDYSGGSALLSAFSFPSSAWERKGAKLCFASRPLAGREAELPDRRSQAELGNEGTRVYSRPPQKKLLHPRRVFPSRARSAAE